MERVIWVTYEPGNAPLYLIWIKKPGTGENDKPIEATVSERLFEKIELMLRRYKPISGKQRLAVQKYGKAIGDILAPGPTDVTREFSAAEIDELKRLAGLKELVGITQDS